MRDAAGGFQCPDCVHTGHRETRTGRTTYGGTRSRDPRQTTIALIVVNAGVWLAVMLTGGASSRLVDLLALRPDGACDVGGGYLGLGVGRSECTAAGYTFLPGVADGAVWQLISSAFMHVQLWHVAGNMLMLFVLGPQLEQVLGRLRFLALYLVSALAGGAAVMLLSSEYGLTLGASGAVYGMLGAFVILARKTGGDLRSVLGLVLLNVLLTFVVPNVSWQGHLGGFLGGVAVTAALVYAPRGSRRAFVQAAGIAAVTALALAAIVVRVLVLQG
ncbi:rhomboid family intramembrane serine protease [Nocardioides sp. R-C-SC26]|uniref:rhomboid family intramembrane serine protease n=1 Tax=Nocardioides sp. R-C-SC26 TaxID=2870414 RepID=UPI001E432F4F|nr:rhomboid family intramembrane serine protease [Nocardioides sp. R-C-SC26]